MTISHQPFRQPRRSQAAGGPLPQLPTGVGSTAGRPVVPVDWFRRMPNGGTIYLKRAALI
ncbi:hypothetical protein C8D87_105460 [Lentzea atacamensis]|uniref:Uncharacterized protein n=2 Tax=Lentzea TaxID=165301 RepID=A0ABX9EAA0_9PSEU|nr:hypothetical protein C8D87_105460 [Lentzea atacamensis]